MLISLKVTLDEGIASLVLFLYLCASYAPVSQLLKSHCLQSIGPLTQLPSTRIKVLSKALIARLIPTDAVSDESTVMTLIEDEEVDYLISLVTPIQLYKVFPVTSVMMDLSRSPHNMFALASKDIVMKLSEIMESLSENNQAQCALLIWRVMELDYNESEGVFTISNNGTLQMQSGGWLNLNLFRTYYMYTYVATYPANLPSFSRMCHVTL